MLCSRCAKFGVEATRPATRRVVRPPSRTRHPASPMAESEYELAVDFDQRIRKAREAKGWKREELAKRTNEKLSIIEKLEKGKMRPDDDLLSKLERTLQVRLRERVEERETKKRSDMRPLTLGDLIRRQG